MPRDKNGLTPKQAAFVAEYLVDLNATQAAIRAGYSRRTAKSQGQRLLTNVDVADAIKAGKEKRAERVELTQDYVLSTIMETVDRCRQAVPVTDKLGNPIMVERGDGTLAPAYVFNSKSVLHGCDLLGKHLGLYTERMTLDLGDETLALLFGAMPPELAQVLKAGLAARLKKGKK